MSLKVLVVGLGNMGMSHALAYMRIPGFAVVGLCERRISDRTLPAELSHCNTFSSFEAALADLKPALVSINALPQHLAGF